MRIPFLLFCLASSLFISAQAKVKFVNLACGEFEYPRLNFDEDIKTYSVHVHLHDFIDDYEWSQDKVLDNLTPLRNYAQTQDESDIYVHLDYYIKKEMESGGEVINVPLQVALIDGAGKTFFTEWVLSDIKVAQATADITHNEIVALVQKHLATSVAIVDEYLVKLLDGRERPLAASNMFTIKKGSDADQKKFDDAIGVVKDKLSNQVVSKVLLGECAPATDFWKEGLNAYDKSSAEYLVCGANLFYLSLKANDPVSTQSYYDSIKDIDNAWTPKESILSSELDEAESSVYHDITSFAEGGKLASDGNSNKMKATGRLKLESGDIVEGNIRFSQNQEGEYDGVTVFQSLNDSQKYGMHQIKGGQFDDTKFVKVETKRGDYFYEILESADEWQVIRPLGDSGYSLLAIGNSNTEKSYHFEGELKINDRFKTLFQSCSTVVTGANEKKYGRKLKDFVALIQDLSSCN